MNDRTNHIFLFTSSLFALLIWHNLNSTNGNHERELADYDEYMQKKISKIVENREILKSKSEIINRAPSSIDSCEGCCEDHDGVTCKGGTSLCTDGTPLSDQCIKSSCNACPVLKNSAL